MKLSLLQALPDDGSWQIASVGDTLPSPFPSSHTPRFTPASLIIYTMKQLRDGRAVRRLVADEGRDDSSAGGGSFFCPPR